MSKEPWLGVIGYPWKNGSAQKGLTLKNIAKTTTGNCHLGPSNRIHPSIPQSSKYHEETPQSLWFHCRPCPVPSSKRSSTQIARRSVVTMKNPLKHRSTSYEGFHPPHEFANFTGGPKAKIHFWKKDKKAPLKFGEHKTKHIKAQSAT